MASAISSPYVLVLVGCLVLTGAVTLLAWYERPRTGATELAGLLGAILAWGGLYAVGLATYDEPTRKLIERVMWVGVAAAPAAWVMFALTYTGRGHRVTPRLVQILAAVSAVVVGVALTNPLHGLLWVRHDVAVSADIAVAVQSFGPLFWLIAAYYYALVLLGAYLLIELALTADGLYIDQSIALAVGAVVPAAANVLSIAGIVPLEGLDLTPYAFTVSGVAFGYALTRTELFRSVPAARRLGRDALIDTMRDPVLITDEQHRIVETNPAAEHAFDFGPERIVGTPITELFGTDLFDQSPGEPSKHTLQQDNREFDVTASPVSDWQERSLGHILVFRDVTERTLREQRLSVFNRLLRHNLRNELTVVNGHAAMLAEKLPEADQEHVETIHETTERLSRISNKARTIDQTIDPENSPSTANLPDVVELVLSTLPTPPGVRVETELPDQLVMTCTHTGLLDIVVQNLVENAIEHNDSDQPLVEIRLEPIEAEHAHARLVVADNGPKIPPHEIDAVTDSDETQLDHSTSLGLWTVYWCVRRLGGTLAFETSRHGGNRVEVRLPATTSRWGQTTR